MYDLLKTICPVELRRLDHVVGNAAHELPHEKDIRRAAAEERRHEHGVQRIREMKRRIEEIQGHHGDNRGNHHGGKHDPEHDLLADELHLRKAVGAQRRNEGNSHR